VLLSVWYGIGSQSRGLKRTLEKLIGLALDDLEQGNLDVETALRLVARRAWDRGYRAGANLNDDLTDQQLRLDQVRDDHGTRAG
jgi:hypothetical protein